MALTTSGFPLPMTYDKGIRRTYTGASTVGVRPSHKNAKKIHRRAIRKGITRQIGGS